MPYKPEEIQIENYTGTNIPCAISRSTVLPRVLSVHGSGLSVLRALQKIKEVLLTEQPSDDDLTIALSDLEDLIGAVK